MKNCCWYNKNITEKWYAFVIGQHEIESLWGSSHSADEEILCFSAAFFPSSSSPHTTTTRGIRKEKKTSFSLSFVYNFVAPHNTEDTCSTFLESFFHISYNYSFVSHSYIHECSSCLCFTPSSLFGRSCTSALCLLSCKEFIFSFSFHFPFVFCRKISLTYFLRK